ncbi:MAG TPA: TMEM175 family protein [Candidatus Saccharimonadia bacterium]|nr:TMEM175 family protein [Candidatus Saccharimonadia bacterium]
MDRTPPMRKDGFRERGHQVTRLEAFVDAAFAFAVTLLVIRVGTVPESVPAMVEALKGIPAFAASFALVAMFWHAHNTWSRRFGLDDGMALFLSLLLVFLVLLYVYPLRMMFGLAFGWATRALPEAWRIQSGYGGVELADVRRMYIVYAVAWSTLGFVVVLLYRHAWKLRAALGLTVDEQVATRVELVRWSIVPALGVLSMVLAMLLPFDDMRNAALAGIPGMVYALMAFTGAIMQVAERRERARMQRAGIAMPPVPPATVVGPKRRRRRRNRVPA